MIKYHPNLDGKYVCLETYHYYSARYDKGVKVEEGYVSDGATHAIDIPSSAWFVHDKLCETAAWGDRTPVTAFQAAMVLRDILLGESLDLHDMGRYKHGAWRYLQSFYWPVATFIGGCVNTRKNGWWSSIKLTRRY